MTDGNTVDVAKLREREIDYDWLAEEHAGHLEATPENVAAARAFIFGKWRDRARELGHPEPADLTNACKFCALFGKALFGGTIDGHYDHVFNRIGGEIVDFTAGSTDVRAMSDPYRSDEDFLYLEDFHHSLGTCIARVRTWAAEFEAPSPSSPALTDGGLVPSRSLRFSSPADILFREESPMPQFRVTFEDVAFSSGELDTDLELSEAECGGFTDTSREEGTFPAGVLAILSAHLAADDSVHEGGRDEDGDVKVFVSIDLLVEAESQDAAYDFKAPADLLTKVSDMISTDYSLEGGWEVNGVDDVAPEPAGPAA